jgi:hypothetical protein
MPSFEPVSVGVVNGNKSGHGGRRLMSKGIHSVTTVYPKIEFRSQGKEVLLNGLFNTGGVYFGRGVERGGSSSSSRKVATVTRTTSANTLVVILPIWAKNNSVEGVETIFSGKYYSDSGWQW